MRGFGFVKGGTAGALYPRRSWSGNKLGWTAKLSLRLAFRMASDPWQSVGWRSVEDWQAAFLRVPFLPDLPLNGEALLCHWLFQIFGRWFWCGQFIGWTIARRFFSAVPSARKFVRVIVYPLSLQLGGVYDDRLVRFIAHCGNSVPFFGGRSLQTDHSEGGARFSWQDQPG